jgi:hypothetical protein
MINGLSAEQFASILHAHVSPTSPIQSQEHLFGRERQLEQVQQALYAPGRSVFVYGDRGVGKTSLAQTVAYSHQSSTHDPVLLACGPQTTFSGLMTSALRHLGDSKPKELTTNHRLKIGFKGFGVEGERTRHEEHIVENHEDRDLNAIVSSLLEVSASRKNESAVIVVDEFDRISDDVERSHFADFIKQVGDQRIPIHFVFCGVAESLQKLLGAHGSCYRYVDGIELKTLTYDARFEIIDNVAKALGVRVDDRPRLRIAAISDGFPHYIHRMCEQLFWQMFKDPRPCEVPTADHYQQAVALSVLRIEQHLRITYDKAVLKDASGYEQVLWAVADHSDLIRNTEGIHGSYIDLMNGSDGEMQVLERHTVVARLNALKGPTCANILVSPRKGWYQFRESMMRGYVRLRAEEVGCELALDYSAASSRAPSLTWRPRPARRGQFGTRPRDWQKLEHPN